MTRVSRMLIITHVNSRDLKRPSKYQHFQGRVLTGHLIARLIITMQNASITTKAYPSPLSTTQPVTSATATSSTSNRLILGCIIGGVCVLFFVIIGLSSHARYARLHDRQVNPDERSQTPASGSATTIAVPSSEDEGREDLIPSRRCRC